MTPPDEVLAAMARASCEHDGFLCLSCESAGKCLGLAQHEGQKAIIRAALTAAAECGWKLVPAAEHERLSERVAALDEPYVDDRGEHWVAPTAFAYAAVCKALRTCKAELGAARAGAEAASVGKRVRKEDLG